MTTAMITSRDVRSYLTVAGWRPETLGALAEIWSPPHAGNERLLVPILREAPDFDWRIQVLVDELTSVEQRSETEIREDMARQFVDITDLRALHPELIDDTIPLSAGYELISSARDLVVAAAGSTLRKTAYFGASMPARAREYARHVRLGQTKRGSYIIPIISPPWSSGPEHQGSAPDLGLDVGTNGVRGVLTALSEALDALHGITVGAGRLPTQRQINETVGAGVSHELCMAVFGVLDEPAVTQLDIDFRWGPGTPSPRNVAAHIEFPEESAHPIRTVADRLKPVEEERDKVVIGEVTQLKIKTNQPGGQAWVEGLVDGQSRTIRLDLDELDYQTALACHKHTQIIVNGRLRTAPGQVATMIATEVRPHDILPFNPS
jgi:hypothetical protein